jgi:hypothetical protein
MKLTKYLTITVLAAILFVSIGYFVLKTAELIDYKSGCEATGGSYKYFSGCECSRKYEGFDEYQKVCRQATL